MNTAGDTVVLFKPNMAEATEIQMNKANGKEKIIKISNVYNLNNGIFVDNAIIIPANINAQAKIILAFKSFKVPIVPFLVYALIRVMPARMVDIPKIVSGSVFRKSTNLPIFMASFLNKFILNLFASDWLYQKFFLCLSLCF